MQLATSTYYIGNIELPSPIKQKPSPFKKHVQTTDSFVKSTPDSYRPSQPRVGTLNPVEDKSSYESLLLGGLLFALGSVAIGTMAYRSSHPLTEEEKKRNNQTVYLIQSSATRNRRHAESHEKSIHRSGVIEPMINALAEHSAGSTIASTTGAIPQAIIGLFLFETLLRTLKASASETVDHPKFFEA
jgi:hypothetical protein